MARAVTSLKKSSDLETGGRPALTAPPLVTSAARALEPPNRSGFVQTPWHVQSSFFRGQAINDSVMSHVSKVKQLSEVW